MRRGAATTRTRARRQSSRKTRTHRQRAAPPRDLRESLESTHRGLQAFLASLERSGFRTAVAPYRDMQLTLIAQRLWSRDHKRDDLEPNWSDIAQSAREIHAVLAGLGTIMAELATIDSVEPGIDDTGQLTPSSLAELAVAFVDSTSVSARRLSAVLSWPDDMRRQRLAALVASGVLERRGWGRGLSYRLTPAIQKGVSAHLGAALARSLEAP